MGTRFSVVAFIRTKTRGEHRYAYLVGTYRDPGNPVPRQRVLAYLGRADRITLDNVPVEWREDPGVARWFGARGAPDAASDPMRMVQRMLAALVPPDRAAVERIAREGADALGVHRFLDEVAAPAMRVIGDRWHAGELSVADEHLATSAMAWIVRRLRDDARTRAAPPAVLLTAPEGERHHLGLVALECSLAQRGISTLFLVDLPRREVAKRAAEMDARLVLVSVTQTEHLDEAARLARAIRDRTPRATVVFGGAAFQDGARKAVESPASMAALPRLLRDAGLA